HEIASPIPSLSSSSRRGRRSGTARDRNHRGGEQPRHSRTQEFFGKNIATLFVIAPFFVMPTVSLLIWKNMIMDPVNGLIATGMKAIGLPPIDWFGNYPMLSIILIVSWEWLPFAFLILFTSLKSLDQEQKEAATIDGAGPFQSFFYIVLPHLQRAI